MRLKASLSQIFLNFRTMKRFFLLIEGMRIAVGSLLANRLRSALTMLGVSIGIFAITIIFTLVNSLTYNLNKNLSDLGNSILFVYHIPWSNDAMSNWQKYMQRPLVTYNEYNRLKKNLENVDGVSFEARMKGQTIKYKKNGVDRVQIRAVTEDYVAINSLEFENGRPFTQVEIDGGRSVCIIGHNLVEPLFGGADPLGKEIRLRGRRLLVIGVTALSGTNMFGSSPDDMVLVPYGFGQRLYDMKSRFIEKLISVRVSSTELIDRVEGDIVGIMRAARGMRPKMENNFEVNRPEMLLKMFADVTKYLFFGGLFISFFSVVVGGFGIGNIMFSTVKERSFEIGLQKALGATRGFILFQFLFESVLLCFFGGIVGLLLNWGVSQLIQLAIDAAGANFEMMTSIGSVAFGVAISVTIGLLSGFIPSNIASKMDPVEAMRA